MPESSTNLSELRQNLAAFFGPAHIKWKPGATSRDKKKVLMMPYVSARAIMDRLDDAVGLGNWTREYRPGPDGGVLCGISIRIVREGGEAEWVTYWDGAENSKVEAVKGGLSDSFKRAAVALGIGRYLYSMPSAWVAANDGRAVRQPEIPPAYLPKTGDGKRRVSDAERPDAEKAFHATAVRFYGDSKKWDERRPHDIRAYADTAGFEVRDGSTNELTTEHLRLMTDVFEQKIERKARRENQPPPQSDEPRRPQRRRRAS